MNKVCGTCGYAGENTWRDGKYYCAMCGNEIDVSKPTPMQNVINATCPICRNDKDNVLRNGRCYCSMCGTEFDYVPPVAYNNYSQPAPTYNPNMGYQGGYTNQNYQGANYYALQRRRDELEQEKSHRMTWGIIFLFLFWPVGLYHFYKWSQANKELKNLR